MERVFSVEEISDPFWAPHPPPAAAAGGGRGGGVAGSAMNRCPSELYFQRFLQEAGVGSPTANSNPKPEGSGRRGGGPDVVDIKSSPTAAAPAAMDPVEYNAMLKQKLEKDLAAVAIWRASGAMPPESSVADSASPNTDALLVGSQNYARGIPVQNKIGGGPSGIPGPSFVQNEDVPVKQATSSSSREPSDDDDMEGDAETTGNANPAEQKQIRRKQSNRESARRSRSRKAAHLKELEDQVAQLSVENSSLLRRLADVNQRYNDAAVDNRVLKADVETLRAKVKMAEDTVKRVTGASPLLPAAAPDLSFLSMPFINGSPSDATSDASASIQDDLNSYFATGNDVRANNTYMPEIASSAQVQDLADGALANGKMDRTASLQRVASLEHLQKRICGGPTSSGSASWDSAPLDLNGHVSKN